MQRWREAIVVWHNAKVTLFLCSENILLKGKYWKYLSCLLLWTIYTHSCKMLGTWKQLFFTIFQRELFGSNRPIRNRLKPKFSASPMDFQLHFAGLFSCLWPNDGKVITFYDHVFGSGRRPSDLRSFSELTICVYFCHKESHSERFCSLLALFRRWSNGTQSLHKNPLVKSKNSSGWFLFLVTGHSHHAFYSYIILHM